MVLVVYAYKGAPVRDDLHPISYTIYIPRISGGIIKE